MAKIRSLSAKIGLMGKRVLLRVDWNVPLHAHAEPEASLKIERSLETIQWLQKKKAIVILLTHIGRPEKRDRKHSTQHLVRLLKETYGMAIEYHGESVAKTEERKVLKKVFETAQPGSVHLLENVRFEEGEDKNLKSLAKAYAELGEVFVNDAFASSHRAHVSVVGIASLLPSYAGLSLTQEVHALTRLIQRPKKPVVAIIGGLKLSTKLPVIAALRKQCDRLLVGGAMATTILAAAGKKIGSSYVEEDAISLADKLVTDKVIGLPIDVVVTKKIAHPLHLRTVSIDAIEVDDKIVDVGKKTLKAWANEVQGAQTILWNGPIGISEIPACGFGSRFIARLVATRAKGKAFGVAGGGDTLPLIIETKTLPWFDHVSMGGGALLEFVANQGKLPGLEPLMEKSSK